MSGLSACPGGTHAAAELFLTAGQEIRPREARCKLPGSGHGHFTVSSVLAGQTGPARIPPPRVWLSLASGLPTGTRFPSSDPRSGLLRCQGRYISPFNQEKQLTTVWHSG